MYVQGVSQSDFRAVCVWVYVCVWGGDRVAGEGRVRWCNASCQDFAWSPFDPSNIQQWPLLD